MDAVLVSGCSALRNGPAGITCERPEDGTLRVWAAGARDRVRMEGAIATDADAGNPATAAPTRVDDGTLIRVKLDERATRLVVRGEHGTVTMLLGPRTAPSWFAEARAARQHGDAARADALAAEAAASPGADDATRAFAAGLRARIALANGAYEEAFTLFREGIRLHRASGRLSDAADDSFALVFALNQRSYRYAEAHAFLDDVHAWVGPYADGIAREAYYRGTLATETGDARAALHLLHEAKAAAARIGLAALERNATNALAHQLELLGRIDEATALLHGLEASTADQSPCERAEIAINLGFGSVLAIERGGSPDAHDAVTPLETALTHFPACGDAYLETAALDNLALAALQRKDLARARALLARARQGKQPSRGAELLFRHDLDGRIALAANDARAALTAFEAEEALARTTFANDAIYRAAEGRGEALERLGRIEDALASYRAAEEAVDDAILLVPLGEGRGSFAEGQGKAAARAVELLTRGGRNAEALTIVRRSRARIVRGMVANARVTDLQPDERARWEAAVGSFRNARAALDADASGDWKRSRAEIDAKRIARSGTEERLGEALDTALAALGTTHSPQRLPELSADRPTLAYHPLARGWIGFVARSTEDVTAFPIPVLPSVADPVPLARALVEPAVRALHGAKGVRILPFGALGPVDFHMLPFEGTTLGATMPVEYPLDLPPLAIEREVPRGALVVADPTLDLAAARGEGRAVVAAIRAANGEVSFLEGSNATSQALRDHLPRVTHLHYAGHGRFAGRDAWGSELPLAAGGHLTIGDILAMRGVPRTVVLSGCETARADASAVSLGIAQAFLVAGAEAVVAPVRPVDDTAATRFGSALYPSILARDASDSSASVATHVRDVQQRLLSDGGSDTTAAFRVLTR